MNKDDRKAKLLIILVFVFTVVFTIFQFLPFGMSELAFVFAVPILVWGYYERSWKRIFVFSLLSNWVAWFFILFWLRYVIWAGLVVVSGYVSILITAWYVLASYGMKRFFEMNLISRLIGFLGLAGLWVVLEWVRSFLFTGFPWLPLAASQWERPVMLQIAPYAGSYGISFVMIFFNVTLASFVAGFLVLAGVGKRMLVPRSRRSVEFYIAVLLIGGLILVYAKNLPSKEDAQKMFKVGIVQPDVKPELKWKQSKIRDNLKVLTDETLDVAKRNPDFILWPETALPEFVNADEPTQYFLNRLSEEAGMPLLASGLMVRDDKVFDALIKVDPAEGISNDYFYGKRICVPFGEYIPFRQCFSCINKVVPISFDLSPSEGVNLLTVEANGKEWKLGGLICYEDIFPKLGRESVNEGADCLIVVTNDGWYGKSGAYQHMTHSVLRAAELRRPVVRCGNAGWSGWIDDRGYVRDVAVNEEESIFFRGNRIFDVYRDEKWAGRLTLYAQYGDWFVGVCIGLVVIGGGIIRFQKR